MTVTCEKRPLLFHPFRTAIGRFCCTFAIANRGQKNLIEPTSVCLHDKQHSLANLSIKQFVANQPKEHFIILPMWATIRETTRTYERSDPSFSCPPEKKYHRKKLKYIESIMKKVLQVFDKYFSS